MCGRYVQATPADLLAEQFGVDEIVADDPPAPSYNVAPRADVLVVAARVPGRRVLEQMRWGLVPSWAESPAIGDRLINARAESVLERPAFEQAFRHRRCLIPADGFYEWQATPGRRAKQPVYVHRRDGASMAFAGLWEVWRPHGDPGAPWLVTCSIITTRANAVMAPVHDRMPVLLTDETWSRWLDPAEDDTASLEALLVPGPDADLELWPVRRLVNDAVRDGPDLVERVPAGELDDGIQGSLFS